MHKLSNIAAVMAAACLCAGTQAHAQQQPENAEQQAVQFSTRAVEAFKAGEYELAGRYFLDAHALSPDPVLLYNAAYAYGRAGDYERASDLARRAEAAGLADATTTTRNTARRTAWRAALRAQAIAAQPEPESTPVVADISAETDDWSHDPIFYTGLAVTSLGVGALVSALVVDGSVADQAAQLDEARADGDAAAEQQLLSDIEDDQQLGRILVYTGAGLAVGGAALVTWAVLDSDGSETVKPTVVLEDGGGQVGFVWSY